MINIYINILYEIFLKLYEAKSVNLRVRVHTHKHFYSVYNEAACA